MRGQSLINDGYAVVRLRESVKTRRRFMSTHGQFGALVVLPIAFALELVEGGRAKMPGATSRGTLRAAACALAEAARRTD
ncbi:hypothetical protein [Azohydromonas sediminis]|uniref:hypothetical protein n=1 Tax=Azohydromonas sediminis TaxID=2259674 RepID=UPI000E6589DA|nr:hypothetical protein [Azohydromonas sediminis]